MTDRTFPEEAHIPRRSLKSVLDHIRANNMRNVSISVLAKIAGVTPHHFSSLFTKATGVTPHQFVLRERIERAKVYLQDETLSIRQVSRLTGFRTQEHFTKVFRKIAGMTPTEYRSARSRREHEYAI